ncbi:MAG: hypothetical protein IPK42_11385 [Betaproteobacteria bacterium]|nr:hypothetical protein [Betaproteobacteria bacterium]
MSLTPAGQGVFADAKAAYCARRPAWRLGQRTHFRERWPSAGEAAASAPARSAIEEVAGHGLSARDEGGRT